VLPVGDWRGVTTFAPGGKNARAATVSQRAALKAIEDVTEIHPHNFSSYPVFVAPRLVVVPSLLPVQQSGIRR